MSVGIDYLPLRNAASVAHLMSNVHPDEAVRTRAEQAEQDASRLETEIGLDRDLFDALAASASPDDVAIESASSTSSGDSSTARFIASSESSARLTSYPAPISAAIACMRVPKLLSTTSTLPATRQF